MKKRVIALLVSAMLLVTITGCGADKKTVVTKVTVTKTTETAEPAEEAAEEAEYSLEDAPKFALNTEASGYEGFRYLCEVTLEQETEPITIYMPTDQWVQNPTDMDFYADYKDYDTGFFFTVRTDSAALYETVAEDLAGYVEDYYSPDEYTCLTVSEPEAIGEDAAAMTISYLEWNEDEAVYEPTYKTFYEKRRTQEEDILMEVSLNPLAVSEDNKGMVEELEAFYPFAVACDAEEANAKVEAYTANPEEYAVSDVKEIDLDGFHAKLPEGWDYDPVGEGYAPGGDVMNGCSIYLEKEFVGEADRIEIVDEKSAKESYEILQAEEVSDIAVENIGETGIGETVKIAYRMNYDGEEVSLLYILYIAYSGDGFMYTLTATSDEEAYDTVVEEAAEYILENSTVEE